MVIILTSNYDAGILQFAVQMKDEFTKIKGKAVLFAPEQSGLAGDEIELYERRSSLLPFDKCYLEIANRINDYQPECVFVCDTNLITGRIILALRNNIPVYTVIHDVTAHASYNSIKAAFKEEMKRPYVLCALKRAKRIVLMSKHSHKLFGEKYPHFANKTALLRLGAHVPAVEEEQPTEVRNENGYILFFGRIDKYKGIINLLKSYEANQQNIHRKVIIAGRGRLTEEERRIIQRHSEKIILVERYIRDGEMIWLFRHASCTVLPYIEASQSGVLSMSYFFGKPVIVSNLDGLTEFVEDGATGVIYHNLTELGNAMEKLPDKASQMKPTVDEYYMDELEWSRNLKRLISES
jgi:glycosyltransferase involved in cell wall biosynthesis